MFITLFSYFRTAAGWFGNSDTLEAIFSICDKRVGDTTFVIVNIKVIRGGEDGDDRREPCCSGLAVHAVSVSFKSNISDQTNEVSSNVKKTNPASCASCARIIESKLFLSRKAHAA